eukprot:604376-Prymnesium_polylepis.1
MPSEDNANDLERILVLPTASRSFEMCLQFSSSYMYIREASTPPGKIQIPESQVGALREHRVSRG